MRRVMLLILVCLVSFTGQVSAASRESVEAMFSETGMGRSWDAMLAASMDAMFDSVERTVAARINSSPARSQRQVRVDASLAQVRQILRSVDISWNIVGPDVVQMYMDLFSQEDLDALAAFYSSPAGHALFTKKPSAKDSPTQDISKLLDPQVFTQDEIDGIQAFYQSPAAKALKTAMPQIGKRFERIVAARTELVMPQIRKLLLDAEAANAAEAGSPQGPKAP